MTTRDEARERLAVRLAAFATEAIRAIGVPVVVRAYADPVLVEADAILALLSPEGDGSDQGSSRDYALTDCSALDASR